MNTPVNLDLANILKQATNVGMERGCRRRIQSGAKNRKTESGTGAREVLVQTRKDERVGVARLRRNEASDEANDEDEF